ncbi:MAG: hypothetical protein JNM63_00130, partial [Spirochaetia bacterium]|nr:hypothetical protein [Spirochaetia bacterium]
FLYFFRGDAANFAPANQAEAYYREMHWDYGAGPFDSAPKPMFLAYAFHAYALGDMKFSRRQNKEESLWCFTYSNAEKAGALLWAQTGTSTVEVKLPFSANGWKMMNLMLGEKKIRYEDGVVMLNLGTEPVYLTGSKAALAELESAFEKADYDQKRIASQKAAAEGDVPSYMAKVPGFMQAREARSQDWKNIDLRPFCNVGFFDEKAGDGKGGWTDQGELNNLDGIAIGRQTIYHVPVEIIDPEKNNGKSCIVLKSKNTPAYPENAKTIPVNEKAEAIYFTHSCAWAKPGETIAQYTVRYSDGTERVIPLVVNQNTADWWMKPLDSEKSCAFLVRVKRTSVPGNTQNERFIRIFEWQNPDPTKTIVSLDFSTANSSGIPALLAVTVRKS